GDRPRDDVTARLLRIRPAFGIDGYHAGGFGDRLHFRARGRDRRGRLLRAIVRLGADDDLQAAFSLEEGRADRHAGLEQGAVGAPRLDLDGFQARTGLRVHQAAPQAILRALIHHVD